VTDGDPLSIDALRGNVSMMTGGGTGAAQVPVIPQECT
jgi:hypothetical protein